MVSSVRAAIAALALLLPCAAWAQDDSAELAKKLANPVSSLISVPLQHNYDCCYGPSDGFRYTLNVQPVVPLSISKDWNLIVRTIVPIVYQQSTAPGSDEAFGFSDVTQSFFFSPKESPGGIIWAVGPALLYPLGGEALGTRKWGAGPTFLVLKQQGPVTLGVLTNQIWSYAGDRSRPEVNQLFLQPFFNYTYPSSTALTLNTETTYNWITRQWTVPINFGASHVYKFGGQRVQLAALGKVYAETPSGGPGWGLRFVTTFLFPT